MPLFEVVTIINSSIETVFNNSRSIDLHMEGLKETGEKAIAGRTSGHIELDETVTWSAVHFGVRQTLTSKITKMEFPFYFRDEQLQGIFKKMEHDHYFEVQEETTVMKDVFYFESPFGILGRLANVLFLEKCMRKLIEKRCLFIKKVSEVQIIN